MLHLDQALKENDTETINQLVPQYREMDYRHRIDKHKPFLTDDEITIVTSLVSRHPACE